jgi:hypothetical protein
MVHTKNPNEIVMWLMRIARHLARLKTVKEKHPPRRVCEAEGDEMADNLTEITTIMGTKLTPAELATIDPKNVVRLQAPADMPEVEGQCGPNYYCFQTCPYCGCVARQENKNSYGYSYFTCQCCGGTYRG